MRSSQSDAPRGGNAGVPVVTPGYYQERRNMAVTIETLLSKFEGVRKETKKSIFNSNRHIERKKYL